MSIGEVAGISINIGEVTGIILLISVWFFGYKIYNMLVDIHNKIDELWQGYGGIQGGNNQLETLHMDLIKLIELM
jgi:hypothetical protein